MNWTNLSNPLSGIPPARYAHGFTSAGGKLYVHGGLDASGAGNLIGGRMYLEDSKALSNVLWKKDIFLKSVYV